MRLDACSGRIITGPIWGTFTQTRSERGGAAGAAGALAMATLGCAVLAAKAALRARGRALRQVGADLRLHWRLAFQTGLGRRPLH